jgi:hypothetical protein
VVLAAGALAFPLSRAPRIELVAHLADVLLVVAFCSLAWLRWRRPAPVATATATATAPILGRPKVGG